ncbi:MAG: ribosome maturation factor RimP [Thermodesulfovibrionia bacterium]|nr:ribosome maturation factor RimP [Thermodesulfovibrionia bacterium]
MNIEEIRRKVREIIEPVIKSMDMTLEDMKLTKMGRKFLLRVVIDKEGRVSLDDCEQVSREVEAQLDVEDPIPSSYTLEVSSPGLDRPLRNPHDFKRFCGRTIRVVTSVPIDKQTFFIGEIVEANDTEIVLLLPKDKKVTLQYKDISRARLEVKF